MKFSLRRCALVFSLAAFVLLTCLDGQRGSPALAAQEPRSQDEGPRLPSGKLQRDEILKAEHAQNLKDAAQLVELAQQLQEELEKNEQYVLSVSSLKKTDDIEKLVRKIRSRLRHN